MRRNVFHYIIDITAVLFFGLSPDCKEGEECFIDGECITDGTANPDNDAVKCDSTKNPEGWTPKGWFDY